MAQRSTPQFRVVPPTLEPGTVLLHQLTELSLSSSPAVRTARYAGVRALAGAATVAVIGVTTWVAGAAPGSDASVGPAERPTHVTTGLPSTGDDVGPPQSDGLRSAPDSPWSPGLSGTEPSVVTVAPEDAAPDERTAAQQRNADHSGKGHHQVKVAPDDTGDDSGDDSGDDTGHGNGHGNGQGNGHSNGPSDDDTGNGHGNGHAYGHDASRSDEGSKDKDKGENRGNGHANGHANGPPTATGTGSTRTSTRARARGTTSTSAEGGAASRATTQLSAPRPGRGSARDRDAHSSIRLHNGTGASAGPAAPAANTMRAGIWELITLGEVRRRSGRRGQKR